MNILPEPSVLFFLCAFACSTSTTIQVSIPRRPSDTSPCAVKTPLIAVTYQVMIGISTGGEGNIANGYWFHQRRSPRGNELKSDCKRSPKEAKMAAPLPIDSLQQNPIARKTT